VKQTVGHSSDLALVKKPPHGFLLKISNGSEQSLAACLTEQGRRQPR
jgi:hypothetical protein